MTGTSGFNTVTSCEDSPGGKLILKKLSFTKAIVRVGFERRRPTWTVKDIDYKSGSIKNRLIETLYNKYDQENYSDEE